MTPQLSSYSDLELLCRRARAEAEAEVRTTGAWLASGSPLRGRQVPAAWTSGAICPEAGASQVRDKMRRQSHVREDWDKGLSYKLHPSDLGSQTNT